MVGKGRGGLMLGGVDGFKGEIDGWKRGGVG